MRIIENNRVVAVGKIVSNFEFDHKIRNENFYTANLSMKRESGVTDIIPIMVSDRLVDVSADWIGVTVKIEGQYRSYNRYEGDKSHLLLVIFTRDIEVIEELPFTGDVNYIYLDGYICKEPMYRITSHAKREIVDVIVAANRPYGKSDYIPCIAWSRNARFISNLEVGTHIQIEGRIQSREYQKIISDSEYETRTAYEVSINDIALIQETEDEDEREDRECFA